MYARLILQLIVFTFWRLEKLNLGQFIDMAWCGAAI